MFPRLSGQPHHRRQLRRLRGSRRRDRLRLHRRRPPLLQQHRASPTTRASTSSPATRSCATRDALAFVRFRHTDNDIVRNARQQDFLRWAKDQYSVADLIVNERDTLLRIFGEHTQTDPNLHTTDGLINLFDLVAFSDGHAIKQIPFPAILLPCAPVRRPPAARAADAVLRDRRLRRRAGGVPGVHDADHSQATAERVRRRRRGAAAWNSGARQPKPGPRPDADVSDGQAQAKALGTGRDAGLLPEADPAGSNYCSADCTTRRVPARDASRRLVSARLPDPRPAAASPTTAYRMTLDDQPGPRRVLRGPGHDLAEPADPQEPDRDARPSTASS